MPPRSSLSSALSTGRILSGFTKSFGRDAPIVQRAGSNFNGQMVKAVREMHSQTLRPQDKVTRPQAPLHNSSRRARTVATGFSGGVKSRVRDLVQRSGLSGMATTTSGGKPWSEGHHEGMQHRDYRSRAEFVNAIGGLELNTEQFRIGSSKPNLRPQVGLAHAEKFVHQRRSLWNAAKGQFRGSSRG